MRTCNRIRPERSASCNANASGALREPGHNTTSRTPPRISSSTTTRACVVDGFIPTACHSALTPRRTWTHRRRPQKSLGEELQRGGVDGLWPFEEPEVTGVGYLQKAAVGQDVGDLASQVGRSHYVVREANHQHRRRDGAVRR